VQPGIRLGIDPGRARIGLALSDRDGLLAMPLETVPVDAGEIDRIVAVIAEHEVSTVFVGLPLSLSGRWTASTRHAYNLARAISERVDVEARMIDERLTTTTAQTALRASGRSQRAGRSVIDQIAAVTLLQQALDTERQSNRPAGWALSEIVEMDNDEQ
jgi:putative Holliday junction resolvase